MSSKHQPTASRLTTGTWRKPLQEELNMQKEQKWIRVATLAATVALMSIPAAAQSVGVYRGASGARDTSIAGADSVLGTTPVSALSWNPAGLASLEEPEFDIAFASIHARGKFTNRVDSNGLLRDASGVVPDGAIAFPLRQRSLVVAGGLLTDGAIAGSWNYQDAPGAAGATYGLAEHRSGVVVLRPTAGVGARLGSRFAVGGSVSMLWNRNELTAPYIFQTQAPLVGLKTLLDVHATGTGWSGSVGATARPHRKVQAGVAWRSRTTLTTRGQATGDAWAQFKALGVAADSTFEYSAAVRNSFPAMFAAGGSWEVTPRVRVAGQLERWGWHDAFSSLPITLTNGTNAVINSLVGSATIKEIVPLDWKNQLVRRVGTEYTWSSSIVLRGGYAYSPSPVPTDTLTPMTAAIVEHTFGAGLGVIQGKTSIDVGFQWSPATERRVQNTALKGSEYNGTSVAVGAQGLVLSVRRRF
jgi:long-subunit fatty acid transport protein